jgi:hypothetical protein
VSVTARESWLPVDYAHSPRSGQHVRMPHLSPGGASDAPSEEWVVTNAEERSSGEVSASIYHCPVWHLLFATSLQHIPRSVCRSEMYVLPQHPWTCMVLSILNEAGCTRRVRF